MPKRFLVEDGPEPKRKWSRMDAGCGTKVETLVETEQDGIGDTLHNSCVMIMKRQCRTEVEMAPYLKVNARCAGA